MAEKTLRICPKGHKYHKSSDCPTCPVCEAGKKPKEGFLSKLSAPAFRALQNAGIKTLKQLSKHTEKEIAGLHGMGPSAIKILKAELKKERLTFSR